MFCTKCGFQMEDDAVFCPKCGASTGGAEVPAPNPPVTASPAAEASAGPAVNGAAGTAAAAKPSPVGDLVQKLKKKPLVALCLAVVVVAVAVFAVKSLSGPSFSSIVNDMLAQYPYANNAVAQDGSYLKIDTNPYDEDIDDLTYAQLSTFSETQEDSLGGIQYVNGRLGFTDAVYSRMMSTTALMGVQTAENEDYRVSWTYHPDNGLEVMYEKK